MVTVIGDVHGRISTYAQIVEDCDYSVQVGDMSFDYYPLEQLVDPEKHKFFGGNHDNYDTYDYSAHSLGDFGSFYHGGLDMFFVRGAFSVDIAYRLALHVEGEPKQWWHEEELTYTQMVECQKEYEKVKPSIMLTHTAPSIVIRDNFDPFILNRFGFTASFTSHTAVFLQHLFEIHQPDLWVFGHFHKRIEDKIGKTEFVCLPELGFIDI